MAWADDLQSMLDAVAGGLGSTVTIRRPGGGKGAIDPSTGGRSAGGGVDLEVVVTATVGPTRRVTIGSGGAGATGGDVWETVYRVRATDLGTFVPREGDQVVHGTKTTRVSEVGSLCEGLDVPLTCRWSKKPGQ